MASEVPPSNSPGGYPTTGRGQQCSRSYNILEQALQNPEANSNKDKTEKVESGMYIGKGLAPVPIKLTQWIWRCAWDFIDMAEILPELWTSRSDENPTKALATRARGPVTDMLNKNSLAVKKVRGQSEATMAISDQNL